jgi:hypothetical protein
VKPQINFQAENEAGSTPEAETVSKRKSVSKRDFIDPTGNVVDKIEDATGSRYVLLDPAGNHTFDYQCGEAGKLTTMAAIFGLQTKIGNVANTVLNDKDEPGTPTDAASAIKAWMSQVEGGTWAERTTGGPGARVDKAALAGAIVAVAIASGKADAANEATLFETISKRLEEGWTERNLTAEQYVRQVRQVPAVAQEYATRVGKQAKSIDDMI